METENVLENENSNEEAEQVATLNFKQLGINEHLLKAIEKERFEKPTEIQEKSIPFILQGKDVIAGASTGSGKTLAFASAILQNTKKGFGIQSLILAPTRELAEQICKTINKFSHFNQLKIISVYGGVSILNQIEELEYADVVIGTPGRILDHLSRKTINLSHLKILVLDEADRMLDMGFKEDVERIINNCSTKRQTLLFSATISEDITRLAQRYMKEPMEIFAEQYVDPKKLTQIYYDVDDNLKYSLLKHLLEKENAKLVMVFCNTRKNVDFVANNLKFSGINVLPMHGGFSQDKRNKIMEKFNSNEIQILICTDIAARGLDIPGISHVYNYDMPKESKEYLHRIGRTARAGKEGKVINIIASRDYENFRNILRDDELYIKNESTPLISLSPIKWMPEKRFKRGFGRNNRTNTRNNNRGSNNFRSRNNNRNSNNFRSRNNRGGRNSFRGRNDDRRNSNTNRFGARSRY